MSELQSQLNLFIQGLFMFLTFVSKELVHRMSALFYAGVQLCLVAHTFDTDSCAC